MKLDPLCRLCSIGVKRKRGDGCYYHTINRRGRDIAVRCPTNLGAMLGEDRFSVSLDLLTSKSSPESDPK